MNPNIVFSYTLFTVMITLPQKLQVIEMDFEKILSDNKNVYAVCEPTILPQTKKSLKKLSHVKDSQLVSTEYYNIDTMNLSLTQHERITVPSSITVEETLKALMDLSKQLNK